MRWSPLSGAQLEEMVREATRLAAQLQHSHLPPLGPGPSPPGGGGSPRNPRRETFVVKDSPVRELLPTVPPAREVGDGAAGGGHHVRGHEGARGMGCAPPVPLPAISLLPGHPWLSPPASTQGSPSSGQGNPCPGGPFPAVPPAWGRGCGTGQVRAPPERASR